MTEATTELAADTTAATTDTSTTTTSQADAPFYQGFTDEALRGDPSIIKYKSVEELARGLVHAEKRLGVPADQLLRIPTKPDDKDAYREIYRKLGAPEKPEDYGIKVEDGASDEVKAYTGELATLGVDLGLNKTQMAGLVEMLNTKSAAAIEAETKAAETAAAECATTLKQEWGAAFDQKKKDIGLAINALAKGAGVEAQDVIDDLNEKGLGSSVALNKLFAHFATLAAEPGAAPGGGARTQPGVLTPAEAKNARLAIESDPEQRKILEDGNHAQHKELVKKRQELLAMEIAKAD